MVGYNLTGVADNITSVSSLMQGVNDTLLGGWFGSMFLIGLFAVLFSSFMFTTGGDVTKSMNGSLFMAFVAAVFLRALSLVPNLAIYICLIGLAISLAFTWKD